MIQPCFLVGHPIEVSPLAKKDPANPNKVLRFQVVAGTAELCNAFAELNDPIDQRQRFEDQMKLREAGDAEAQMIDEDFVEALEYGMPPAFGFGLSERFFSFIMNKSVRECVIFPAMKEKESETSKKELKIAVAVINNGAKMEAWQKMNAIAHLNAAFAARKGKELFLQDEITTKDQEKIKLNIKHAIMIKESSSSNELSDLVKAARSQGFEVAEFTREMIETTNDKIVVEKTREKSLKELEYLGALVFGNKKEVEKLTSAFPLVK
jgi:lysyl-tRNA synthetase class 2